MLVNKIQPSDAYHGDADDNLHLTEVDGYFRLVEAMIARAYQDSVGNVGMNGNPPLEMQYKWTMDGLAFFRDGRCRHWCEHLGITDFELLNLGGR